MERAPEEATQFVKSRSGAGAWGHRIPTDTMEYGKIGFPKMI